MLFQVAVELYGWGPWASGGGRAAGTALGAGATGHKLPRGGPGQGPAAKKARLAEAAEAAEVREEWGFAVLTASIQPTQRCMG